MAVKIDVPYRQSIASAKSPEETFRYLADFERAIPGNFPGLETFTKQGEATYHWSFEKVKYNNYEFHIQVVTRFEMGPGHTIKLVSVPKPGHSSLTGSWNVEPQGSGSRITFTVDLQTELPIPFLLKAVAAPITQKELGKVFDRYLANVGKALT
jgi:carbon monoxide dehydrogenase subunit G